MAKAKESKGKKGGAPAAASDGNGAAETGPIPVPRLFERYKRDVIPTLTQRFRYTNPMQVPRVTKISLNVGLGEALQNGKLMEAAVNELMAITGQRPVVTKSRKAIANFRLRENQAIGCMVTLRRNRMYEFLDRLINIALPRVRDFRGVSNSAFDGRGNYSLGIREQIIFPEIDYDKVEKVRGMNVTIATTARNDDEGRALLEALGMPFRT